MHPHPPHYPSNRCFIAPKDYAGRFYLEISIVWMRRISGPSWAYLGAFLQLNCWHEIFFFCSSREQHLPRERSRDIFCVSAVQLPWKKCASHFLFFIFADLARGDSLTIHAVNLLEERNAYLFFLNVDNTRTNELLEYIRIITTLLSSHCN